MKNVNVVIGAGYGDEGKGLVVDYLTNNSPDVSNTLVVRANSGAQAAHTVQIGNDRFVFHMFGSGTLRGAATLLSRHVFIDPTVFWSQVNELKYHIINRFPPFYVDTECNIVTPYDVALNRIREDSRKDRHGSCGMGFHEAVVRSDKIPLMIKDVMSGSETVTKKLKNIKEYFNTRVSELDLPLELIAQYKEGMLSDDSISNYSKDLERMVQVIQPCIDVQILDEYEYVIFEMAQGLRLDMDSDEFPHVTHSKTGLHNVLQLITSDLEEFTVNYVIRTTYTRHGAGKLRDEITDDDLLSLYKKSDPTNVFNEYQHSLRFAPLDIDQVEFDIRSDLKNLDDDLQPNVAVFLTHCDTLWNIEGKSKVIDMLSTFINNDRARQVFTSWGPDSSTITKERRFNEH